METEITFDDGTKALRDAASPCLLSVVDAPNRLPDDEKWYITQFGPDDWSFCARPIRTLNDRRGSDFVYVWVITGQDRGTKALLGEWRRCRVETEAEQIERLVRERNAALTRAKIAEAAVDATSVDRLVKAAAEVSRLRHDGEQLMRWVTYSGALIRRLESHITKWRTRAARKTEEAQAAGAALRWLADEMLTFAEPTRGDLINVRARLGAAVVEAEEAVKRAQTSLRHAGSKSRQETARLVLLAAEARQEQALAAYETAKAAEVAAEETSDA